MPWPEQRGARWMFFLCFIFQMAGWPVQRIYEGAVLPSPLQRSGQMSAGKNKSLSLSQMPEHQLLLMRSQAAFPDGSGWIWYGILYTRCRGTKRTEETFAVATHLWSLKSSMLMQSTRKFMTCGKKKNSATGEREKSSSRLYSTIQAAYCVWFQKSFRC